MNQQLNIDFTVTRHNNRESEMFYEENMDRFSDQCKKVWRLLKEGDRLTVYDAVLLHWINSLPRRVKDINDAYIKAGMPAPIKSEWVRDSQGKRLHKEYFI